MSWLIRLYPPSWRKRYGAELESLVHETPGRIGVALDLLIGAAIAYRDIIHSNRVLSAAGSYLHGLCVAVLLQAIVFVSMVFVGQRSTTPADFRLGPMDFLTIQVPAYFGSELRPFGAEVWVQQVALPIVTEMVLLGVLGAALAVVLALPRVLRSLR